MPCSGKLLSMIASANRLVKINTLFTLVQATARRVADLYPVAPVAYPVILENGIGQFLEFEFPRVHTHMNS